MATAPDGTYYPRPPLIDHSAAVQTSENHDYDPKTDQSSYDQLPVRTTSNSKSYASRAGPRPDLFVDTTPPRQASTTQSPTSPTDLFNLSSASALPNPRKGSVSDRSPLQNLEVKLGGISKEEKRARIEQAENVARQRSNARRGPGEQMSTTTSTQQVSKGPATNSTAMPGPTQKRRTSENDRPRVRSYGYDSSLTGVAAAAAVGAYQASRRRQYESRSLSSAEHLNYSRPSTASRSMQTLPAVEDNRSTRSRSTSQVQLQDDWIEDPISPNEFNTSQQFYQAPAQNVRAAESNRSPGKTPPQTAAGQQVRKQVAFQTEDSGNIANQDRESNKRHGFRAMFQKSHQQGRRYEMPKYLEEWRQADAATLTSVELDLDSRRDGVNDQTWWERDEPLNQNVGNFNAKQNDNTANSTFDPPLTLKCGPLLRYTGMQLDSQTEKEFWKGSVLIVTQDSTSSYGAAPVLKLFKQSMDLVPSHPRSNTQALNDQNQSSANVDLIAGLPKLSRTGRPLFVKPVHDVDGEVDLSQMETNEGLFLSDPPEEIKKKATSRLNTQDGEKLGRFREVKAIRLHSERGFTFWRFNLRVELSAVDNRIAYRINGGPAIGFWVPARGQSMNVMFHSCNGFSLSVNSNEFSGPDPLWRDVLNNHQVRPFHCMIGGGDQIYNDAAMKQTQYFQEWLAVQNPEEKHDADFSVEMQNELEQFYLDRYSMWFSQGLFGMANAQIPMINMWDDHDIIDGFGSYPHHFMSTPVFTGIGAVAFKYYMLFQQQSVPDESEQTEPSWLMGAAPGPYINQLSRSIFVSLGKGVSFLGLDCRTERMRDEVLSQGTYDLIFDRCHREIIPGETKHLIVLLGVPIAYPRLNFLENVLTSRALDPIKALGRAGMFSGFINKFDGGVEILDDLDDHWTAKHHKHERNWFIQELQELAAEKSVRITILGGDVHLAAVGQFYSNPALGIPKDHDHRYMLNVVSSAIVNTPPPEMMADVLNKRNKVHHLDKDTDEDMVPMFLRDVTGKARNNNHLLPRRNWCSIRGYQPGSTPPPTPPLEAEEPQGEYPARRRSFSFSRSRSRTSSDGEKQGLLRRFSTRRAPPSSYYGPHSVDEGDPYRTSNSDPRVDGPIDGSITDHDGISQSMRSSEDTSTEDRGRQILPRSDSFRRRPTKLSRRASRQDRSGREGHIDIEGGLDIVLNCEINQRDPAGFTMPYRLIVPALSYQGPGDSNTAQIKGGLGGFFGSLRRPKETQQQNDLESVPYDSHEVRSSPPLGGRAMPESALGEQRSISQSNNVVLEDRNLPSNQPPSAFKGPVPLPLEESSALRPRRTSAPITSYSQGAVNFGDPPRDRTSMEESRNLPARSSSNREVESRPTAPMRRWSGSGPPAPKYVDQLPASVRKRYSEMNDPAVKEYTQATDPSRKRYSQMNDPSGHKRFSQYEPLSRSRPSSQREPVPPPAFKPEETYRRYSSGPMEMPLLPTNINQLRSSTHRTLQSTDTSYDQPNATDPATNSAPVANNKALPAVNSAEPTMSQESQAPARSNSYAEAHITTARVPAMFSLSRGHAKQSSKIPSYPSPLTSHAPQADMYTGYDNSRDLSPQFATTNTNSASANTTRPLGREYNDEAYGYRSSTDAEPNRPSWGHSHGGIPDKVARHFGGYDEPNENAGRYDDERESSRKSRGLGGMVRRVSESAAARRRERRQGQEERYDENWNGGEDEWYDHDERRSSWKFWQR